MGAQMNTQKDDKWVLLSKKKIPKRGTTTKMESLWKCKCISALKNTVKGMQNLKYLNFSIPEFYSYIKVDIEVMERKSGMKFPPNLMSEFKIG